MKRTQKYVIVTAMGALLAPAAMADQVQVEDLGGWGNRGRNVSVTLTGGLQFADGSSQRNVWAGHRTYVIDGTSDRGYAIELTGSSGNGTFEQGTSYATVGETKAAALSALFAKNNEGEFLHRENATAFQALVWEIIYDYDGTIGSLDLADGNVRVDTINGTIFTAMKNSIFERGGPESNLAVATNGQMNDFIRVVPLPSTAGLAALGLGGLTAVRRRRG